MPYTPPLYQSNGVGCISNNGNQSVTLSEDGFQLSTNLLTTPIVVTISENGLSTTNPNGLEVISPLNMTGNNIFNVDTITYPDNTQFIIQNPLSVGQGELKIYSDSTNPSTSSIFLNAVDILSNAGNIGIYYTLPINFTMNWSDNYNYTNINNWERVARNSMNLPVEYFTQTGTQTAWRYEFAINCFNCNNQIDKAYAMYIEFIDNNSNSFQSFCFNLTTPFTTHKNNSTYSATSTAIENYCLTDYIDFAGSSGGPFIIRLWRYGDNNYSCDFNAVLTLSKTNLV